MDFKKQAADDLRKHEKRKNSLDSIDEQLQALEYRMQSYKANSDTVPIKGGMSSMEERLIDCICEQNRLQWARMEAETIIKRVDTALKFLDDKQRKILDRFYINPVQGAAASLCDELGYEKSHIYRLRDQAVYNFTIALYGIIDL